ncbi:MAG: type 2 lanthipeptide synthetase LanM family protein [Pseudomonadota bacterium]
MTLRLTSAERSCLIAQSTTLEERLAGQVQFQADDRTSAAAANRFKSWVKTSSGDDPRVLDRVLSDLGADLHSVAGAFGPVSVGGAEIHNRWVDTFDWILAALDRPVSVPEVSDPALPFKPLFDPLVVDARRRRDEKVSEDIYANFTEKALQDFDADLVKTAITVCGRGLLDAFTLARHVGGQFPSTPDTEKGGNSAEPVDVFAAGLKGRRLKSFFLERPVLARLLATVVDQWIDVTALFMNRMGRDMNSISADLLCGGDPGRVCSIGCGLSDRHRGGQSVYKVTFENGASVGYKPKDLSIDRAFNALIDWMAADGAPASAGTVKVSPRGGYGWVEWVAHAPCTDEEEARRFFHRSGAMLCLIRMLQGNDFHFENVVARGQVPVPIDLETITHPRIKEVEPELESESAFFKTMYQLGDSVASVGYLPNYIPVPGGGAAKVGGLDDYDELDAAQHVDAPANAGEGFNPNLPSLNGRPLSVMHYEADLLAGYREMFAYIDRNGARIAAAGGPLDMFENCLIRPVLRATRLYAMIQHRSLARRAVVDGAAWSAEFDMLARISASADGQDPMLTLCHYERKAMAVFDIPFYQASTSSRDLICGDGEVITDFFEAPCLDTVRTRFKNVPKDALPRDEVLIERSLRMGNQPSADWSTALVEGGTLCPSALVACAVELGERICSKAIRKGDASCWLDLVPVTGDERFRQPLALGPGLLSGSDGIALFFADLHAATGDEKWRAEARRASRYGTDQVADPSRLKALSMVAPLGLGTGIGGLIMAQTALATVLQDERHLKAANAYAATVTDSRISEARDFGLFQGLAGAVSALVALYRLDPSQELADRIARAASRLAKMRLEAKSGRESWQDTAWTVPQAGLMHGASGIALALLEAYCLCGDEILLEAVRRALDFETSLLEGRDGWPDLRNCATKGDIAEAPVGLDLSSGAAGIGIARLAISQLDSGLCRAALQTDVRRAGALICNAGEPRFDGLFDGAAGQALFLARAAVQMPGTVELMAGPAMLTSLETSAREIGQHYWEAGRDCDNPSVLFGSAGVGVALLESAGEARATRFLTFGACDPLSEKRSPSFRPSATAA